MSKSDSKVYVKMVDPFMSGWGPATGKRNVVICVCDSQEEASLVLDNVKNRGDMKYINVFYKKPYYNPNRYYVQFKTKEDMPVWYEKDSFKHFQD